MNLYYTTLRSPLGLLVLFSDGEALRELRFTDADGVVLPPDTARNNACFVTIAEQLEAYFEGELTTFELPLMPIGTAFQHRVWNLLLCTEAGQTMSYSQLAARMGDPLAVRAVASANARNPIPIIIPCHRVIGANGDLTGFSGGLWRKKYLLEHEARMVVAGPLFA